MPSAVTQLRYRLSLRTNEPSGAAAACSVVCQRPSIMDPIARSSLIVFASTWRDRSKVAALA